MEPRRRPLSVTISSAGAGAVGLATCGFAVAAILSGKGSLSGWVGLVLIAYGLANLLAGFRLWQLGRLARGPVVAFGLLNALVGANLAGAAPWVWALVGISVVVVVSAAWPTTTQALRR